MIFRLKMRLSGNLKFWAILRDILAPRITVNCDVDGRTFRRSDEGLKLETSAFESQVLQWLIISYRPCG